MKTVFSKIDGVDQQRYLDIIFLFDRMFLGNF